jgi:hypothetical protein
MRVAGRRYSDPLLLFTLLPLYFNPHPFQGDFGTTPMEVPVQAQGRKMVFQKEPNVP